MGGRMTRSITIRLPENEYESVREECFASGRRSISEYVRAILFRRNVGAPYVELNPRLQALETDIRALRSELSKNPESRLRSLENEVRALRKESVGRQEKNEPKAPTESDV